MSTVENFRHRQMLTKDFDEETWKVIYELCGVPYRDYPPMPRKDNLIPFLAFPLALRVVSIERADLLDGWTADDLHTLRTWQDERHEAACREAAEQQAEANRAEAAHIQQQACSACWLIPCCC
ncbi:hypothetical protein BJF83_21440 [Nocardiopsis sp. CNR-923]|uniref:hypothetical protein n=1 Tax=Nocardiopsis sp. CNR-923 TaxID=1904965 RepID=UPI00095D172F|nr:hypothetical protein [Nocardiopsis sp. CNR-923]OLT26367.1 hypothetical protein BJF83_21440 [Nocardiopsis sp. CNR-923]